MLKQNIKYFMDKQFFIKMAEKHGFPHPSDEQIIQMTKIYNLKTTQFSEDHMKNLFKILTIQIEEILTSIQNDDDYKLYEKYFKTYPILYLGVVPKHIIKDKILNKYKKRDYEITPIDEIIFETLPDPITIQGEMYNYLKDDMEVYYKIYTFLENNGDVEILYKFVLDPVTFLKTDNFRTLLTEEIRLNEKELLNLSKMITSVIYQQII